MLDVGIIGTGYVGLVSGACLAELGCRVVCLDTNQQKIASLQRGEVPFYEPGLEELVSANAAAGRLAFTTDMDRLVAPSRLLLFVAVGTPTNVVHGGADLRFVQDAVLAAANARAARAHEAGDFLAFVIKSTVPVGTCRGLGALVGRHLPAAAFAIASNPEFLREGTAVADFMQPDRIVVSSPSEQALSMLEKAYRPLTLRGFPLLRMRETETAELMKYAANALLATKIAFINEFARFCERAGADIGELAHGVGLDHRIGRHGLDAGPGFGGSCFPKDLRAIVKLGEMLGSPLEIADAAYRANDRHKHVMALKIRDALGHSLHGRRIAFLGLAFKAETDDMREAPALTIIPSVIEMGAEARAYDPVAEAQARAYLPSVAFASSVEEALDGADAAVILTEWRAFRNLAWDQLAGLMRRPLVIDLRNIYDPQTMARDGVEFVPLGARATPSSLAVAAE